MNAFSGSLYARVVIRLSLLLSVTGVALILGAWLYARVAAEEAYDRVLIGSALQIAENTWVRNGVLNVDLPVSAFSVLSQGDRVFYKVLDPSGRIVAGDAELNVSVPLAQLQRGPILRTAQYQGESVRVVLVGREMFDVASRGWATIILAETEGSRRTLATSLTLKVLVVVVIMGFITIGGTMFATRFALEPMGELAMALSRRDPNSLTPLDVRAPVEAEPLVNAINAFIRRLDARVGLMRRVIGDVAHQLRTPITSAISQIELLEMQATDSGRERQVARVKERLAALGALVQQLVSHAMVLHRSERSLMERVDVVALVRKEMTELLSGEVPRKIEISFDAPDETITVDGDPVTLREAFRNILGNALRYGARTRLTVQVHRRESNAEIRVIEDGPGIDSSKWASVRQAFNPRSDERGGASLGLAIADEVLKAHDGQMRFVVDEMQDFCVILVLPLHG